MDRHLRNERTRGGLRGAKIEESKVRIGRNARQKVRRVRRKSSRVGARIGRQSQERLRADRGPDLDGSVPAAGAELVLGHEIPVDGEDFTGMLLPALDWVVVNRGVEELNASITRGGQCLIFVGLGPGQLVERVLGGIARENTLVSSLDAACNRQEAERS